MKYSVDLFSTKNNSIQKLEHELRELGTTHKTRFAPFFRITNLNGRWQVELPLSPAMTSLEGPMQLVRFIHISPEL